METISEYLRNEENQKIILEKVVEALRRKEEWGRHGLFTKISEHTGLSLSYVGQVLSGKKPFRENFLEKMAEYLEVTVESLREGGHVASSLHQKVTEVVDNFIEKYNMYLPANKKAELINVLCEDYEGKGLSGLLLERKIEFWFKLIYGLRKRT
jgi:transcriptional regulator with XRE-family HTH domain